MPQLSANSVTLMDGKVVLSRRSGSAQWQARFKADGRWIRVSTKIDDLKDAREVATNLYLDARTRSRLGVPAQSKRFRDVARLAIDRMNRAVAAGEG